MARHKSTDKRHQERLPGEDEMARVYRAAAQDAPPASLDARVLAAARDAVAKPKKRGAFGGRWVFPLSTAATIVLSLGVILLLIKEGALERRDAVVSRVSEAPVAEPDSRAPSPAPVAESVQPMTQVPAKSKPASPPAVPGQTGAARELESKAVSIKKNEPTAVSPAAAPARRARMAEERVGALRDEAQAINTQAKETSGMNVQADVIAVRASGQPGAYQFSVSLRSPDTGCDQYADWWEVVSADGQLLYRRVLLHSHVDEQPFTRSGGPVPIQADTTVWVRAHMNTGGYGGAAWRGSVNSGFMQTVPEAGFAAGLASQAPLPQGCDF